jgi:type II secretory pathway component PulF
LTTQEQAQFFHQLTALLNSGLSVQQSLNLAGKDCNPSFQRYLQTASAAVGGGQDLASAISLDSRYFDGWTISLLRLAEYSGSLPQTCRQLAIAFETQVRRERLYRSVRRLAITTVWSLLILVAAIFNRTPTGLVKPEFWLRSLAIALLLLGISFLTSSYSTERSQQLAMKLPVVGKLIQARSMIYLGKLALPLSCGVTLLTALELVREYIPDRVLRANLASAARKIRAGQTLSYSLQGKLPPIAMEIIRTGEETGNLDTALQNLVEYYEGDLERRLNWLQLSLRPLSFLAIAGLVAVVSVRGLTTLLDSLPD